MPDIRQFAGFWSASLIRICKSNLKPKMKIWQLFLLVAEEVLFGFFLLTID